MTRFTDFLIRVFVKNPDDTGLPKVREGYGRLAGAVGIISNLALFAAKLLIGLFSGSISIMADAVNNLSDCASSAITLIGFRLSSMPSDSEHPYGHARFEYISGLIVSFLIVVIGYEFLVSSIGKTLHPQPIVFSWAVALVLALSILVKLWQGLFNKRLGKKINSDTLMATAADSRNDVITTATVLLGLITGHVTGIRIDGVMGILVALFIIISGINLVRETISPLLGEAPEPGLVKAIQNKVMGYESVIGMHDLVIHNYGPGRRFASVHVEMPANQDLLLSHDIIDTLERDFMRDMQIELVAHFDPIVVDDEKTCEMRRKIDKIAKDIDPELSTHDFRMVEGPLHTNLIFDVLTPQRYSLTDARLREEIAKRVSLLDKTYFCVITVDRSYCG